MKLKGIIVKNAITSSQTGDVIFLDWIQSDGFQWIDTNLSNTGDYIFEDRFMMDLIDPPGTNDGSWIIGGRLSPSHSLGIFRGTTGFFNSYGGSSVSSASTNVQIGVWINMYFSRFKLTTTDDDGVVFDYRVSGQVLIPEEYKTNVLLGKNQINWAGTGDDTRNMYGKRAYTRIYDANTMELLREYKAAVVNGIPGLYDTVSNLFKKSAGPKNYIAGPIGG